MGSDLEDGVSVALGSIDEDVAVWPQENNRAKTGKKRKLRLVFMG